MSSQPPASQGHDQWTQPNSAWGRPSGAWQAPEDANPVPAAPREPEPSPPDAQPTGAAPRPTVTIDQFRPRRNRTGPIALIVVAIAVLATIVYLGTRPDAGDASADPTPTPSAVRPIPSLPTGGEFANSIAFESDRVAGTFGINDSYWEDSTLVVDVTIAVDWGSLSYNFLAMDIASGEVTPAELPSEPSDLPGGPVNAGERTSGTVRFTKTPGDTQVLLGDTGFTNLTMLAVKGP